MSHVIEDKARGCLAALAIGDALGMPVETMTPDEILAATGGRGVREFLAPIQTKLKDSRNLPACSTTDDTQLALAVARSLIRRDCFDPRDQAAELADEYLLTKSRGKGWGKTTEEAARALAEWFADPSGNSGRHYNVPAPAPTKPGAACGNGVAMKVAPLAIFRAATHGRNCEPLMSDIMHLGLQTHGDPRASFTAVAVGALITDLVCRRQAQDGPELLRRAQRRVNQWLEWIEYRYQCYRVDPDTVSGRFARVWNSLDDAVKLRETVGTGCFALESVPFAIGTFLRHPLDLKAGLMEAVNAGGDTDTTAAIVGALIGANVGIVCLPHDWYNAVPDAARAGKIARQLIG